MPEMHLSISAICRIAWYNLRKQSCITNKKMFEAGIKNHYPVSWACGEPIRDKNSGFTDWQIKESGTENGGRVTCPKCIELIKKYGEK